MSDKKHKPYTTLTLSEHLEAEAAYLMEKWGVRNRCDLLRVAIRKCAKAERAKEKAEEEAYKDI